MASGDWLQTWFRWGFLDGILLIILSIIVFNSLRGKLCASSFVWFVYFVKVSWFWMMSLMPILPVFVVMWSSIAVMWIVILLLWPSDWLVGVDFELTFLHLCLVNFLALSFYLKWENHELLISLVLRAHPQGFAQTQQCSSTFGSKSTRWTDLVWHWVWALTWS